MAIKVLKFGGTSLANIKLMKNAAAKVLKHVVAGEQVVVVVSAMAGVTDHLVSLANEITSHHDQDSFAEYANIVITGEQVAAGLFSLLLQEEGIKARSWLSWQIGIITDEKVENGNILEINCQEIKESFTKGYQVAVVAGFQGITNNKRNSTLGRGGSDTSAIVLAGSLNATQCDIYTDVEGVFTADPRIVAKAHKLEQLSYEEMIEFARLGAKVLQENSVRWAKHYQINVQVLSSFTGNLGTIISPNSLSHSVVGVALSKPVSEECNDNLNLEIAKVSVIGTNINNNNALIINLENALQDMGIGILASQYAEMALSFIVKDEDKFEVVRLLHEACNLG
jgi:aspartate kinase